MTAADTLSWPVLPAQPSLAPDSLLLVLASFDRWAAAAWTPEPLLTAAERERAAGFRHEPSRRNYLIGRALLRQLLGRLLNCAPAAVPLTNTPAGKPVLAGRQELGFNISHTRELLLVAVARTPHVGVDLEQPRDVTDPLAIALRFFAPGEAALVAGAAAPAAQLRVFLQLWTFKEACAKAVGDGLMAPLDDPDLSRLWPVAAPVTVTTAAGRWWLSALAPAPGVVGAVCAPATAAWQCRWHRLEPEVG